jgi:thiamine biosynthesis lipoprotein
MRNRPDSVRRARPLLGTFVDIAAAGGEVPELERAVDAAFQAVERVHRLMSYHEPPSDISRLNRANGGAPIVIDGWTYSVLQTSLDLQRRSRGLFDIAVASTLERLGLLPRSAAHSSVRPGQRSQNAVELFPDNHARLQAPDRKIDLGGIAKGFAVDQAIGVLRKHGVRGGVVNAGGDLAAFGQDEHAVAIRDPRDPARLMAHTTLCNAALASSGLAFDPTGSGQALHCPIIDPRADEPVTTVSGATVGTASCAIADALTKVVMVAGSTASEVLDHYGASALLVTISGEILATADWHDRLSLAA